MRMKLGELLVKANLVSPQQVREGLGYQERNGGRLGQALVALGHVKDEAITHLLSRRYGVPEIKLDGFPLDPAVVKIVPPQTAWKHRVLGLSRSGATLTLAMADPTNVQAMEEVKHLTGYNVEPAVASETAIDRALERHYGPPEPLGAAGSPRGAEPAPGGEAFPGAPTLTLEDMATVGLSEIDLDALSDAPSEDESRAETGDEIDLGNLARPAEVSPVAKLTNVLLVDCLKRGATEIHVEPYEKEFRVRYRIDGVLYNAMALPLKLREPLTSRLKTMARLDVTERRLPQGGRFRILMKFEDRSRQMDFEVSTLPTRWGEKLVLRLFDKSRLVLDMTRLGLEPDSLERLRRSLVRPHGIVLLAGTRNSGRTNTLYSALCSRNRPEVNIVTFEAPVLFDLAGINQVAVRSDPGHDLRAALRSCLQQDADIVALDPIGDDATVKEVVRLGASSGLLFLATLLEEDAPSALLTLVERCGQAADVVRALRAVVAQRLIRRICANCKVEITDVPTKTLIDLGMAPEHVGSFKLYEGKGCSTCNGTGYRGRVGLFEVMEVSEGIRELVMVGATAVEIKRKALEEGMRTLRMSGLEKIKAGVTTIDEVARETTL